MINRVGQVVLAYLAWIISSVLAFYVAFKTWEAVMAVYVALRLNPWSYTAVSNFTIVILVIVGLSVVVYLEHLYSQGATDGRLWRRFAVGTLMEAAIGAVALAVLAFVR
jgi:hypothetical protein